jgi:hypothetical protein
VTGVQTCALPISNEVVSLRYDSHANLVARGVIPDYRSRPYEPRPFPGGIVPDPRG